MFEIETDPAKLFYAKCTFTERRNLALVFFWQTSKNDKNNCMTENSVLLTTHAASDFTYPKPQPQVIFAVRKYIKLYKIT